MADSETLRSVYEARDWQRVPDLTPPFREVADELQSWFNNPECEHVRTYYHQADNSSAERTPLASRLAFVFTRPFPERSGFFGWQQQIIGVNRLINRDLPIEVTKVTDHEAPIDTFQISTPFRIGSLTKLYPHRAFEDRDEELLTFKYPFALDGEITLTPVPLVESTSVCEDIHRVALELGILELVPISNLHYQRLLVPEVARIQECTEENERQKESGVTHKSRRSLLNQMRRRPSWWESFPKAVEHINSLPYPMILPEV